MSRKHMYQIALIVLIVLPILFACLVNSQPPIGNVEYKQANPFDSNPTAGVYANVGTMTGTFPDMVKDGDLSSNVNWVYGAGDPATPPSFVEVSAFKKPSDNGLTDFTIKWIDIKVSYKAASTGLNDDKYRIVAYVDPSATEIVLADWVTGASAKYDPGSGIRGDRAFSNVSEPNNGVWTWTDLANLRVRVDCLRVDTNNFQRIYLYEVWVTAYSTPYPASKTISVQPAAVALLHAGDVFYVDIYVTDVTRMWGYGFVLNFSSSVLNAMAYVSYGPFVSAMPSEINNTVGYVAVAYKTFDGDPVGFEGSTPVTRIYFSVVADGISMLTLSKSEVADVYGILIVLTRKHGVFASSPRHDVAVTDVTVNATNVVPGASIEISATVQNLGTYIETSDVTASYDSNTIETKTVADLTPGDSPILSFVWDTSSVALGFHQIKVEAALSTDENPADNVRVWSVLPEGVLVGLHDIAVISIVRAYFNGTVPPETGPLNVTRRDVVYINVTIKNQGNFSETFNVTALWQGIYNIGNLTSGSILPGSSETLSFVWNTDITVPEWTFGFDSDGYPINMSRGAVKVIAAPGWLPDGTAYAKGVPFEKYTGYWDRTANNVKQTAAEVQVNRDKRYPTVKWNQGASEAYVGEPIGFEGGPPKYSNTPQGTTITSFRWDFGDDNITEGNYPSITHVYSSPGEYSTNLTVTNSAGLSSWLAVGGGGAPSSPIEVFTRNIKIVSVVADPTSVLVGQNVTISVTIKNDGLRSEGFSALKTNITVYSDSTEIGRVRAPDVGDVKSPTNSSTRAFNWTTSGLSPGAYTLRAVLDAVPYENNTDDNVMFFDGQVTLLWHNVKVTGVTPGKTEAVIGDSVSVSVVVVNQGNFTETFTVTAYSNDTAIGDAQNVTDLAAGDSETLEFTWKTDGLKSGTYTIKAVASNVTSEANTDDNVYVDGSVKLNEPSNIFLYVIVGVVIAVVAVALVGLYFLKFRKPKAPGAQ